MPRRSSRERVWPNPRPKRKSPSASAISSRRSREAMLTEVSDWARLAGYVQYGRFGEPYVVRYGELDATDAPDRTTGAVYLHQGASYVVDTLDFEDGTALVRGESPDWTTHARDTTALSVRHIRAHHHSGPVEMFLGEVDVTALDCDFYAFSGHKMYAPTGIGVLYGRERLLDAMPPWMGGGDMIRTVSYETSTWNDLPYKFEAGTPNIAGFVGLGAAVDYLDGIGMANIEAREAELLAHLTEEMDKVDGLRIIGRAPEKAAVVSFLVDGAHAHDLATLLDLEGVAVRSGQHCAHPLLQFYGVAATCRASLAFYNTHDEIEAFINALGKVRKLLG